MGQFFNFDSLIDKSDNLFNSIFSKINQLNTDETVANLGYDQFKEIFLTSLKENNILSDSTIPGDSQDPLSGSEILSGIETSLIETINLELFKQIDKNKDGTLNDSEIKHFTDFINEIKTNYLSQSQEAESKQIDIQI